MTKERYDWCCPYFLRARAGGLDCEAGTLKLPNDGSREEFYRFYCCNNPGWRRCTAARAMNLHYERAEETAEEVAYV